MFLREFMERRGRGREFSMDSFPRFLIDKKPIFDSKSLMFPVR